MFSQSQVFPIEDEIEVVMNPMMQGSRPTEDIRVGRKCCGCVGKGSGKQHASLGKFIDGGSLEMLGTVTAQPVRSKGVNGDEENIFSQFVGRQGNGSGD
jgi:hypothetical protein